MSQAGQSNLAAAPATTATSATQNASQGERYMLIAAILASAMAFIDGSALSLVQRLIQEEFNADYNTFVWVINGYLLVLASLILVGGALADLYGRKRLFMLGIAIFAAASVVCGLAPSIELLIIARLAQGVGGALLVPGSLANISAVFPPDRRAAAIGIWSTFSTLTSIAGPIIGGLFAQTGFWRGIFFINVPLAAVALFLLTRAPETKEQDAKRPDILGAVLATLGLGSLTYGLTEAGIPPGFSNPVVLAAIAAGMVLLLAFVVVQARSSHPMVPLSLFKSRVFTGTNLFTFLLYAGIGVFPVFLPLVLTMQGYTPTEASVAFLPSSLILIAFSRFTGRIVKSLGYRIPLLIGPTLIGVAFILFGLPGITNGFSDYWTTYFPSAVVFGIGLGFTVAPLTATVMGSAPAENSGAASGVNNAISRVGGVLAIAIGTTVSIALFSGGLNTIAGQYGLTTDQQAALTAEAPRLAEAQVPEAVAGAIGDQTDAMQREMNAQFLLTFRAITIGLAILAWAAAIVAFVMVRGESVERPREGAQNTPAVAGAG